MATKRPKHKTPTLQQLLMLLLELPINYAVQGLTQLLIRVWCNDNQLNLIFRLLLRRGRLGFRLHFFTPLGRDGSVGVFGPLLGGAGRASEWAGGEYLGRLTTAGERWEGSES